MKVDATLTCNGSSATASTVVIDDHRIALCNAVHSEVASIPGICDLTVF
jgi:hypothetical protein